MNIFNRIVVLLLLLVIIVVSAVLVAVPDLAISITQNGLENLAASLAQPLNRLIFSGGGLVIIIIAAFLIIAELRRPKRKAVKVAQVDGGEVEVATDSIARRLEYHVDKLADVTKVTPVVVSKGKGVEITLNLETSPEIDVPMKTEEVCQVAREVVEKSMGLVLDKIQVNIKHAPYPKE